MTDNVFYPPLLNKAVESLKDQYGKAAKIWEIFIGDKNLRTQNYKSFLVHLLKQKGCKRILDAACGTGIDSIMLLENGFEVVSVDASDQMLKYAMKKRWNRRDEPAFYNWVIEEANWLTLYDDIEQFVGDGFDAIICLGNSFSHLLDCFGDQREQKQAIKNFEKCLKPGGLLLIDHRNYECIINKSNTPARNIYYNCRHVSDLKTTILYASGKPSVVILDYFVDAPSIYGQIKEKNINWTSEFRFLFYPHSLEIFKNMLVDVFGDKSKHHIYGDFKELDDSEIPAFYIHMIEKSVKIF